MALFLDAPLTDSDVGVEDFEQLFMKLKVMKGNL